MSPSFRNTSIRASRTASGILPEDLESNS
jgi:hypothetical protein